MTGPRHILLWACWLGLCVTAWAQAELRWLEMEHDFGTFNETDGKVSCQMRLVNVGDSALYITLVRTSCGCTAGEYPKHPIAPGDTARVTVTYDPTNRPGRFSKDVFVFSNSTPRRSVLTIAGTVIGRPETLSEIYPVAAGQLLMEGCNIPLGEVLKGRRRTSYVTIHNASATDTLLVNVTDTPPHIKASASPDTIVPGGIGAITVGYDTQLAPLWGLNIDTLTVISQPLHPSATAVSGFSQLFVMAQVTEDFSSLTEQQRLRAPQLTIDSDKLMLTAQQPTATLTLTNTGRTPLELRRLWSPEASVSIRCDRQLIKPGKRAVLTVQVRPDQLSAPLLNTHLTIVCNDPDRPSRKIRLVGSF